MGWFLYDSDLRQERVNNESLITEKSRHQHFPRQFSIPQLILSRLPTQPTFICSESTMKTPEQCLKYVQS